MNETTFEKVKDEKRSEGVMSLMFAFITMCTCFLATNFERENHFFFSIVCFMVGIVFSVICCYKARKTINCKKIWGELICTIVVVIGIVLNVIGSIGLIHFTTLSYVLIAIGSINFIAIEVPDIYSIIFD